ncbi:RING-H2 finger protein ATL74-like [Senna tora]|uniref:RING-type E3 ubiquitin transferase n=1 Tax=Senna tora TaxID=362788 RepID=A0A834T7K5_9FABA|nr:RING-H2 finger protein ATL74-like [Senna tora]
MARRLLVDSVTSEPSPTATDSMYRTRVTYTSDANFDTNMVIILAALLCALICALGLNSMVRCALRCSRRLAFESPDEAAARLAAKGLKKSALRQIPIAVYGSSSSAEVFAGTDCPICLGEFVDGEKAVFDSPKTSTPASASSCLDRPLNVNTSTEPGSESNEDARLFWLPDVVVSFNLHSNLKKITF